MIIFLLIKEKKNFRLAIFSGHFPYTWKKVNITVHKKDNKNLVKNYRQISLLPIFGRIFEKVVYDNLFTYLQENQFLSENQSGFRRNDSCISQLIAMTYIKLLTLNLPLKQEVYFLIYAKLSIKFSTMVFRTN